MPYTFLMVKGKSLDNKPIVQMTRKQIIAYAIAQKIETEAINKARKRSERRSMRRR